MKGISTNIHINDLDMAVYSFWKTLLTQTEQLIHKIEKTPINMDNWHKQKAILDSQNPERYSLLERGFATFFLNRTNHSGILKAGVIGGKKQSGKYKLDARFNKKNLIKRIERIANYSDHIFIYNEDAKQLLERAPEFLPENSLIYLDPPYYEKGQGLYRNFYEHKDHVEIKEVVSKLKYNWIISYDDQPEIREIYKKFRHGEYSLNYSVSNLNRRKATEIIIIPHHLKIPKIKNIYF